MSFTLHSQCLVVFPSGFSSTLKRAWNYSDSNWNCLIRPIGLARTCSGWRKSMVLLYFLLLPNFTLKCTNMRTLDWRLLTLEIRRESTYSSGISHTTFGVFFLVNIFYFSYSTFIHLWFTNHKIVGFHVIFYFFIQKQERVLVGCVPPALAVLGGVHPILRHNLPHFSPHTPTQVHAGMYPPWTKWQTGVKTLPSRNFAGGNKHGIYFAKSDALSITWALLPIVSRNFCSRFHPTCTTI